MVTIGHPRAPDKGLYPGLNSFQEEQTEFFFGRAEETKELVFRLHSFRCTVLYGSKQVGKTSLIRAGLIPHLMELREQSLRHSGRDAEGHVLVYFGNWATKDPLDSLCCAIEKEVNIATGSSIKKAKGRCTSSGRVGLSLNSFSGNSRRLLIILDQFEEYLRSFDATGRGLEFDLGLCDLLTDRSSHVSILIAVRDDFLASLDRYRPRVVQIFDSLFRLSPFTEQQACDSIIKPVGEFFNRLVTDDSRVIVAYNLVERLLEDANEHRRSLDAFTGNTEGASHATFSPGTLQLAMHATWAKTRDEQGGIVTLDAYLELGGLLGVCRTEFDRRFRQLSVRDGNLALETLDVLMTSGGVGSHSQLRQLASRLGVREEDVGAVIGRLIDLNLLSGQRHASNGLTTHVEVAHLVLMPAISERIKDFRRDRLAEDRQLLREVNDAWQCFGKQSQLLGLAQAVNTAERFLKGVESLRLPSDSCDRFSDVLRLMLDNACQKAQVAGYKGAVSSLRFISGDLVLLSGEENGEIKVLDLRGLGKVPELTGQHTTWVWARSVSADGRWVATGSDDGSVIVWSVSDCRVYEAYSPDCANGSGGASPVRGLSFSPDSKFLAIGNNAGQVGIWKFQSSKIVRNFYEVPPDIPVRCIAFNPSGEYIATGDDAGFLRVISFDGMLRAEIRAHYSEIWDLSFRPNGRYLATASQDHTIKIWNVDDENKPIFKETITGHTCCVLSVEFAPDGQHIASGSEDGTACLWDLDGNRLAKFVHGGPVNDVCFSHDPQGSYLATAAADFRVRLWNIAKGKMLRHAEHFRHPGKAILLDIAVSPDRRHVLTGGTDKEVQLWDEEGVLVRSFGGCKDIVLRVAFAPDGGSFAACSFDGAVRLWELRTGHQIGTLQHDNLVFSIAYSPDGSLLATGGNDGIVRLWDVRNEPAEPCRQFRAESGPVWSVLFDPSHGGIIAGYQDSSIQCWNRRGEMVQLLRGIHEGAVVSLSLNEARRMLASGGSAGQICLWDLTSGRGHELKKFHAPVTSVCFSPGGSILACGSLDRSVCTFDAETREKIDVFFGQAPVRSISFLNEQSVAAVCSDGTIKIWNCRRDDLNVLLDRCHAYLSECLMVGEGRRPAPI